MSTIVYQRLRLVPPIMTPSPIEAMVGWLNDPEVVRYSEQRHRTHTIDSQLAYLKTFAGTDNLRMIIVDDAFIGTISAYIDKPNGVADVGILIGDKSFWGQGYGFEAWKAFCDHLFEHDIRKIEAGHMITNKAMMSVCQKYKMAYEGSRTDHFMVGGTTEHMCQWGKFK